MRRSLCAHFSSFKAPNSSGTSAAAAAAQAAHNWEQAVKVWDAATGQLLKSIGVHLQMCNNLLPHPADPNILITTGYDGRVTFLNLNQTDEIGLLLPVEHDVGGNASTISEVSGTVMKSWTNNISNDHGPIHQDWAPGDAVKILDGSMSKDGLRVVVGDACGRILVFAADASVSRWEKTPCQQFFESDYAELHADDNNNVVDAHTQQLPHLSPRGRFCDFNCIVYTDQPGTLKERGVVPSLSSSSVCRHREELLEQSRNVEAARVWHTRLHRLQQRQSSQQQHTERMLSELKFFSAADGEFKMNAYGKFYQHERTPRGEAPNSGVQIHTLSRLLSRDRREQEVNRQWMTVDSEDDAMDGEDAAFDDGDDDDFVSPLAADEEEEEEEDEDEDEDEFVGTTGRRPTTRNRRGTDDNFIGTGRRLGGRLRRKRRRRRVAVLDSSESDDMSDSESEVPYDEDDSENSGKKTRRSYHEYDSDESFGSDRIENVRLLRESAADERSARSKKRQMSAVGKTRGTAPSAKQTEEKPDEFDKSIRVEVHLNLRVLVISILKTPSLRVAQLRVTQMTLQL